MTKSLKATLKTTPIDFIVMIGSPQFLLLAIILLPFHFMPPADYKADSDYFSFAIKTRTLLRVDLIVT